MNRLQKLPTTQSGFERIREEEMLYVDKTKQMLRLLEEGEYLFLSRPRRFGKSLLVNTLKALYEGKKELFEGLYIYDKWEWKEYPVIWLDFSVMLYSGDKEAFEKDILSLLKKIAKEYKLRISDMHYKSYMRNLMAALHEKLGEKVVFLVDEYDKPITDFINRPTKAEENRDVLREFYTTLKGEHRHLHKLFVTGVSKLAKVSVFSGMNNADDLTLMPDLNDVVGLTQEELESNFAPYLKAVQEKFGFPSYEAMMKAIKHWYNGYSWDGKNKIYNPYSIVHFFNRLEFKNFWFTSGTPTLLIDLIDLIVRKASDPEEDLKKEPVEYENIEVTEATFNNGDLKNLSLEGLMFQMGFLTIAEIKYEGLTQYYRLNYPNYEVKSFFATEVLEKNVEVSHYQN